MAVQSAGVQVIVPDQFKAWRRGFETLPVDAAATAEEHWRVATDLMLDKTQAAVHVVSGDLKSTGRSDTRREGLTVIGDVIYGGQQGSQGMVDYAQEEEDRGGEHAYLSIGWMQSEKTFNEALPLTWSDVVAGWRQ